MITVVYMDSTAYQILDIPQLVIDDLLRMDKGFIKRVSCILTFVHVIFSLF